MLVVQVVYGCLDCFFKQCSTFCIPSLCGMLVHSEDTSIDAKRQLLGSIVRNSVVSLRYDGSFFYMWL